MKFLCLFIFLWTANNFAADATRIPANCGGNSAFFKLYSIPTHQPEDRWARDYHGLMFVVEFFWRIDKVIWTVRYKTRSMNHHETYKSKFEDGIAVWFNKEHKSSIFRTVLKTNPTKTELYIKPGNELVDMDLIFKALDYNFENLILESCSITNIKFQECETAWPILVNSTSSTYSSKGTFFCDEGFDLFPLNKIAQTECMANKKWKDEERFKCYQAPNDTRVEGNLEIKEHEKMEIYCNFTETTPHADLSIFSFGGSTTQLQVNEQFARNITIEDDGKEIWCQPISSYTKVEQFSRKGKSPTRKLRVFFAPKAISSDEISECDWITGNSCDFTFQSRPSADTISLFVVATGSAIEVDFKFSNTSNGDNQTVSIIQIEKSQLISQRFRLRVVSSMFPEHEITIPFDLIVITRNHDEVIKSRTDILLIILIGLIIILLLSLVVNVLKRRRVKKTPLQATDEEVVEYRVTYEAADDIGDDSVREERYNIIYNPGDVGAEDTNIASSNVNEPDHLYSTIDATKKTESNLKGETSKQSLQMLNESDQHYSTIIKKKKTKNLPGSSTL